jgi:formate-dependent nitrite reductase membrane component NrfD
MSAETTPGRPPFAAAFDPSPGDQPAGIPSPPAPREEPSYYDVPMLKRPVWTWEVATYFYLGGVSAGAFLLARMAERFGGERCRAVTRAGTAVAALAALPCAPLLIADLGDPRRFHHMLRVFKPSSPMNLGAWTLTAYSGAAFAAALREWLRGSRPGEERSRAARVADGVLLAVSDAAGVPLALLLAGYTGVLLSGTSTPVWAENPFLGALFSAGAINNGASAVSLALQSGAVSGGEEVAHAMRNVHALGHTAEALTIAGFLAAAGPLARPLTRGEAALPFWGAALSLAGAELLGRLPLSGRARRAADLASSALDLIGGFALRWSMVRAGRASADDPQAARHATRAPAH